MSVGPLLRRRVVFARAGSPRHQKSWCLRRRYVRVALTHLSTRRRSPAGVAATPDARNTRDGCRATAGSPPGDGRPILFQRCPTPASATRRTPGRHPRRSVPQPPSSPSRRPEVAEILRGGRTPHATAGRRAGAEARQAPNATAGRRTGAPEHRSTGAPSPTPLRVPEPPITRFRGSAPSRDPVQYTPQLRNCGPERPLRGPFHPGVSPVTAPGTNGRTGYVGGCLGSVSPPSPEWGNKWTLVWSVAAIGPTSALPEGGP
jgi:hypothetical protein